MSDNEETFGLKKTGSSGDEPQPKTMRIGGEEVPVERVEAALQADEDSPSQEEAPVSNEAEPKAEKPRTIRIRGQEYPAEQFEAAMAETQASTDEESAADQDSGSFIDGPINLIKELRETDSGGFKLWAFLFPVGFLYSYNSREEAKNIALSILIPTLVLSLAFYVLPAGLFMIGDALMWIWVVYVSYLVSTRSNALVADGASYDLKDGVLSQLAFAVVSSIIWSL